MLDYVASHFQCLLGFPYLYVQCCTLLAGAFFSCWKIDSQVLICLISKLLVVPAIFHLFGAWRSIGPSAIRSSNMVTLLAGKKAILPSKGKWVSMPTDAVREMLFDRIAATVLSPASRAPVFAARLFLRIWVWHLGFC